MNIIYGSAIVAIALVVANSALALDCNRDDLDQSSMNECAHMDWQAADKDLNLVYKRAKTAARRIDEYLDSGQKPAAIMLRDAQRAWIPYRDQACEVESTVMRGGTMQPLLRWVCMARLTRERTKDLRFFADMS